MSRYDDSSPYETDHVVPLCHGGATTLPNLALACWLCNCFKGANVAGIDSEHDLVVRLFHPRRDRWADHFRWRGGEIIGRTAVGRVTVLVLRLNLLFRVDFRKELRDRGVLPRR